MKEIYAIKFDHVLFYNNRVKIYLSSLSQVPTQQCLFFLMFIYVCNPFDDIINRMVVNCMFFCYLSFTKVLCKV